MADDTLLPFLPWLAGHPPIDETAGAAPSVDMSPWANQQPIPEGLADMTGANRIGFTPRATPAQAASNLGSTLHGLADPGLGAAQLSAHLGGGSTAGLAEFGGGGELPDYASGSDMLAVIKKQEAEYERARAAAGKTGTDWFRLFGNLASPANYVTGLAGGGGGLGSRILTGAGQGAAMGAVAPVDETGGDYWAQKARDIGLGVPYGVVGGAINPAVRGAPTADQQTLQNYGVYLSPGTGGGRLAAATENAATKVPFVKGFVQSDRDRMIDSFNLALHNDALRGIGEQLPANVAAGHQAFDHTMGAFNRAYENLLPQVSFTPGQTFATSMSTVAQDVQMLPTDMRNSFVTLLNQKLFDPLRQGGGILTGDEMKLAETALRKFADGFVGKGGYEGSLGDAVNGVRRAMRQQLRTDYQGLAPRLDAIDRGYARLATLKDAGLASITQSGVSTPAQYLRALANNANPNDVLRGGAPVQDLADAAQRVIGSNRTIGRGPATASDMFISELLAARLGVGGALAAAPDTEYVPSWLKYGAATALALPVSRRGLNRAFSPGQAARTMLGQVPIGAVTATPGLLNQPLP